jgi:NADPH:quinone reductase-like Zn-dependent oxidoreductase
VGRRGENLVKAVVWSRYGSPDGLRLAEVDKPPLKEGRVLVRVHATTVTAGDSEIRRFKIPILLRLPFRIYLGLLRPRDVILGQELAGEVEAVGAGVERFNVRDQIFAVTGPGFGAYAEYVSLPEDGGIAVKPDNMTYMEAAAVPTAGLEALHYLRRAHVLPGQEVVVVGGGGSIGTFAIQLAKVYGAEVTGVDDGSKLETMRAAGADIVLDYTRDDFTRAGRRYDVIFDVMGRASFSRSIRTLNPGGYYLLANSALLQKLRGLWTSLSTDKHVVFGTAPQTSQDLDELRSLIEAGKMRSVIDRRYSLEDIADAHRYVDGGRKQGNVVVSVAE